VDDTAVMREIETSEYAVDEITSVPVYGTEVLFVELLFERTSTRNPLPVQLPPPDWVRHGRAMSWPICAHSASYHVTLDCISFVNVYMHVPQVSTTL